MSKEFNNYQYVEGELMTDRDKKEVGSKFWNKGKWDNFVLPFLPINNDDCKEMVFVDMGCNAGLFLKLAEDKGFGKVIGIEHNVEVYKKAISYKEINNGNYEIRNQYMQKSLQELPLIDYVLLSNTHYYFSIEQWLNFVDRLQSQTCYCIIVTAHDKYGSLGKPSPLIADIRNYFKNWDEIGIIENISTKNDPMPRNLRSICFKNRLIERVQIDTVKNERIFQDDFYLQLDKGIPPLETNYYKWRLSIKSQRVREKTAQWGILKKVELYNNLKNNKLINPVIINSNNQILEGNHRHAILKHLGHKTIIVRHT